MNACRSLQTHRSVFYSPALFCFCFFYLDHRLKCINKLYLYGLEINVEKHSASPHEWEEVGIYFK